MNAGTRSELNAIKRSSGLDMSDPAIKEAWDLVRSEDSDINWCLFGYAPGSSTKLVHLESGESGLEGLLSRISEKDVLWAGMRIFVGDSTKFVRLMFVGNEVGGMKRGKASLHKQTVSVFLEGAACDVAFDDGEGISGVDAEEIKGRIGRAVSVEPKSIILP